ncbi:MAG TPA: tRNA pseudouridine(55) synthase TruB [Thermomicrobiales bacterium]|nr:tRNA pseudouridine(55) synthase TruB [Thermomicrobiales bacterium]
MALHGILIIDKERGLTSHDVVARVRRITGERKVGHTGTLDPAATGVLPVCLGAATKVIEYLQDTTKTYAAEVVLGVATDTDDLEGRIVAERPVPALTADELDRALAPFRGAITQVPPMYAAIKIGGRKLYELARAGETIERAPRALTISTLALLGWEPPVARLLIDCSKGTYIRALARDLGHALGCGAYLHRLVRLRTGPFYLDQALTLAELEADFAAVPWPELALHPDAALLDWPALVVDEAGAAAWRNGRPLPAGAGAPGERCRVYSHEGDWLGLGAYDAETGAWRPEKVVVL